jgi:hypothetical protein
VFYLFLHFSLVQFACIQSLSNSLERRFFFPWHQADGIFISQLDSVSSFQLGEQEIYKIAGRAKERVPVESYRIALTWLAKLGRQRLFQICCYEETHSIM